MAAYAFLIANDRFDDEQIQPLRFPKNDITRLGEVLTNKLIADFKVKPIYNKRHFEVPHEIATDLEGVAKDDTLLVYYAGHGLLGKNGNLYLATQDTRKRHVATTAISVNGLLDLMQESNCKKRILVLDCCHSGAAGTGVELRGAVDSTLGAASKSHGTYILTASTGLQTAAEREEDGHGLLTKHVIEGLESGSAARPGALAITADDLYNYVHTCVVRSGSQEPLRWALGVGGEIILANANAAHVGERIEVARKRFEQHLRDGLISPVAYGNVAGILFATETNERIYDLRRRIFDYADGKIPYTALGPEITDAQPAKVAPDARSDKAVEPRREEDLTRDRRQRQGSTRPGGEGAAVSNAATGPAAAKKPPALIWRLARFVVTRLTVLFWLVASFGIAVFLAAQGVADNTVTVLFCTSNFAITAAALMVARRKKSGFWYVAVQAVISITVAVFIGIRTLTM